MASDAGSITGLAIIHAIVFLINNLHKERTYLTFEGAKMKQRATVTNVSVLKSCLKSKIAFCDFVYIHQLSLGVGNALKSRKP